MQQLQTLVLPELDHVPYVEVGKRRASLFSENSDSASSTVLSEAPSRTKTVGISSPRSTRSILKRRGGVGGTASSSNEPQQLTRLASDNRGVLLAKNSIVTKMEMDDASMMNRIDKCKIANSLAKAKDARMNVFDKDTTSTELQHELMLLQEAAMFRQHRIKEEEELRASKAEADISARERRGNVPGSPNLGLPHPRDGTFTSSKFAQAATVTAKKQALNLNTIIPTSAQSPSGRASSPTPQQLPDQSESIVDPENVNRAANTASVRGLGFDPDALEDYTRKLRPGINRSKLDKDEVERKIKTEVARMNANSIMVQKRRAREEAFKQEKRTRFQVVVDQDATAPPSLQARTSITAVTVAQTTGGGSFGEPTTNSITRGGVLVGRSPSPSLQGAPVKPGLLSAGTAGLLSDAASLVPSSVDLSTIKAKKPPPRKVEDEVELWSFERARISSDARDKARNAKGQSGQHKNGSFFEGSPHLDRAESVLLDLGSPLRKKSLIPLVAGTGNMEQSRASTIIPQSRELVVMKRKLEALETCGMTETNGDMMGQALAARNVLKKNVHIEHGTELSEDHEGKEFKKMATALGLRLNRTTRWCPWRKVGVQPEPWQRGQDNLNWLTLETETNVPMQDLHLYQMYCTNKNMVIILRPVSTAVPDLYSGSFFVDPKYCDRNGNPVPQYNASIQDIKAATKHECRVKGKSINVSLKSSSYPPIYGLIPVNPALGKAYLDAQKRERDIEDMILNAQGKAQTITLLRKLKASKAQAGSLTQALVRDIQKALINSTKECAELMEKYQRDVVLTVDKAAVSRQYLDQFNEAQYLGTAEAKWRGMTVYYQENAQGVVVRNEADIPLFFIKKGSDFFHYSQEKMDVEPEPCEGLQGLKPVEVVTHRTFFMSRTTSRLEEEEEAYLIGPDFDGLAYASQNDPQLTLSQYKDWATVVSQPGPSKSMGMVTPLDVEHIMEVRAMTEWKQNHGYECGNTVKTQILGPGTYVVITPKCVKILEDYSQIVGFYRNSWLEGVPLLLNPNWKVVIDRQGLPCPYGDDLHIPIIEDGVIGYTALLARLESEPDLVGTEYSELKANYTTLEQRYEKLMAPRSLAQSALQLHQPGDVVAEMCEIEDKRAMALLFYAVRRWQLMPPWVRRRKEDEEPGSATAASFRPNRSRGSSRPHSPESNSNSRPHSPENAMPLSREGGSRENSKVRGGSKASSRPLRGGSRSPESEPKTKGSRPTSQESSGTENALLKAAQTAEPDSLVNDLGETTFWDPDFEEYRNEQVQKFLREFEVQAVFFDKVYPKSAFLATLRDFITPEEEPLDVIGTGFLVRDKSLPTLPTRGSPEGAPKKRKSITKAQSLEAPKSPVGATPPLGAERRNKTPSTGSRLK